MIHPYTNENMTRWAHGEFQVQLARAGYSRPMGYCDGLEEDEAALQAQARDEGVEDLRIEKKRLKSGREIWTLGEIPAEEPQDW